MSTNPNYNGEVAYRTNCQRCVPAYEMRMRGYEVTAKPARDNDEIANYYWDMAFKNAQVFEKLKGNGKEEIVRQLEKWGEGARAEIYVQWENLGAHVFVGENRSGAIHFLDPQTGELDVEYYFEKVRKGCTKFFRIDNLEVNEELIKECCDDGNGRRGKKNR